MAVYPDAVSIAAYLSGSWYDISGLVLGDIICDGYGMLTDDDTDRTAAMGTLSLTLNNMTGAFNPQGNGAPLAGFNKGTPIAVTVTYDGIEKTVFRGRVDRIPQSELSFGPRIIDITVVDWVDNAGFFHSRI